MVFGEHTDSDIAEIAPITRQRGQNTVAKHTCEKAVPSKSLNCSEWRFPEKSPLYWKHEKAYFRINIFRVAVNCPALSV